MQIVPISRLYPNMRMGNGSVPDVSDTLAPTALIWWADQGWLLVRQTSYGQDAELSWVGQIVRSPGHLEVDRSRA
jgi:hypothetical protein